MAHFRGRRKLYRVILELAILIGIVGLMVAITILVVLIETTQRLPKP